MQRFDFHSASSIENALDYMANAEGVCKIVAGGTDLIPALRKEQIHPDHVLDIMKIEELQGVREMDGKIRIGPATTFTEMVESQILNRTLPLLCRAGSVVGGPQIRNRGTIGGNILTASPCADVLPAVVALDGVVELFSKRSGKRLVPVSEIMDAPYRPRIKIDELLTGIIVKKPAPGTRSGFMKLGRRKALATARMSLSIVVVMTDGGSVADISIVPGAVMPVPRRMTEAEEILKGRVPDERLLDEASRVLAAGILKTTGIRWSTEYKHPVMMNVFKSLFHRVADNDK